MSLNVGDRFYLNFICIIMSIFRLYGGFGSGCSWGERHHPSRRDVGLKPSLIQRNLFTYSGLYRASVDTNNCWSQGLLVKMMNSPYLTLTVKPLFEFLKFSVLYQPTTQAYLRVLTLSLYVKNILIQRLRC